MWHFQTRAREDDADNKGAGQYAETTAAEQELAAAGRNPPLCSAQSTVLNKKPRSFHIWGIDE